jgi:hypothetical protein
MRARQRRSKQRAYGQGLAARIGELIHLQECEAAFGRTPSGVACKNRSAIRGRHPLQRMRCVYSPAHGGVMRLIVGSEIPEHGGPRAEADADAQQASRAGALAVQVVDSGEHRGGAFACLDRMGGAFGRRTEERRKSIGKHAIDGTAMRLDGAYQNRGAVAHEAAQTFRVGGVGLDKVPELAHPADEKLRALILLAARVPETRLHPRNSHIGALRCAKRAFVVRLPTPGAETITRPLRHALAPLASGMPPAFFRITHSYTDE